MRTKLPTELVPGDRLSAYGLLGERLAPSLVLEADTPASGFVFVTTDSEPLRLVADIPVEIEV